MIEKLDLAMNISKERNVDQSEPIKKNSTKAEDEKKQFQSENSLPTENLKSDSPSLSLKNINKILSEICKEKNEKLLNLSLTEEKRAELFKEIEEEYQESQDDIIKEMKTLVEEMDIVCNAGFPIDQNLIEKNIELSKKLKELQSQFVEKKEIYSKGLKLLKHLLGIIKVSIFYDFIKDHFINHFVIYEGFFF